MIDGLVLLVCGSRVWSDMDRLWARLDVEARTALQVRVVHGGARGADWMAGAWADATGWPCEVFPADWDRLGRRAGAVRNQQMAQHVAGLAEEGWAPVVLAFAVEGNARGTMNMVAEAKRLGLPGAIIRAPAEKSSP